MLEFVLEAFARGDAVLPRDGMGAIAEQLAAALPRDSLRLGSQVAAVEPGRVRLSSGAEVRARSIVVAAPADVAASLLPDIEAPGWRSTACLYFEAPRPPIGEPLLVLDVSGAGPVNNLAVPSLVSRSYAPAGRTLVSAAVVPDLDLDDAELEDATREQLRGWFGPQVERWRRLRTYRLAQALPRRPLGSLAPAGRDVRVAGGLYVCGDHRETASIQGALRSGRRAAEAVLADRAQAAA